MQALEIDAGELKRLMAEAMVLVEDYWATLKARPAYPQTSAGQTAALFGRTCPEDGRGRDVLSDFVRIAEHSRPSTGRFFGYVVGSGEPVGAIGDLFASALNQNVTSW